METARGARTPAAGAPETRGDLADVADRFLDRIYRFLCAMCGDPEIARDLAQETFLRVVRVFRDRPGEAPSPTYLFAAARNVARSHFRRRRTERRIVTAGDPDDPVPEGRTEAARTARRVERRELRDALQRALDRLDEPLRAVFLLSEVEGMSYAEIAETLECPEGTVASRKHLAVRRLRGDLRRYGVEL